MKVNALILTLSLASAPALAGQELYATSFEAEEGFQEGAALDAASAGWSLTSGGESSAVVTAGDTAENEGSQFVRLASGAIIERGFDFSPSSFFSGAGQIVWVEGHFRGDGSDVTLANANYSSEMASAIVHFSAANGIEYWDGNQADESAPTQVLIDGEPVALGAQAWHKITMRLDFRPEGEGGRVYDLWVNGRNVALGAGFRDKSIASLSGFKNLAQNQADFDGFRVVGPLPGDANGDQVRDPADIVTLAELAASPTPDPIAFANSDLNGDGRINEEDYDQLLGILGVPPAE